MDARCDKQKIDVLVETVSLTLPSNLDMTRSGTTTFLVRPSIDNMIGPVGKQARALKPSSSNAAAPDRADTATNIAKGKPWLSDIYK